MRLQCHHPHGIVGITAEEDQSIQQLLDAMHYFELDADIEDVTIQLRRNTSLKLPDAIIAATARVHQLDLLTLDQKLQKTVDNWAGGEKPPLNELEHDADNTECLIPRLMIMHPQRHDFTKTQATRTIPLRTLIQLFEYVGFPLR